MQQSLLEVHLDSLNVSCDENSARQNHFEQCMLQSGQFFTKLLLQSIQEGVYTVLSPPQDNLGDSRFWTVISWIIAKVFPFFSSLDFPTINSNILHCLSYFNVNITRFLINQPVYHCNIITWLVGSKPIKSNVLACVERTNEYFLHKWCHLPCIMTSSIIPSSSIGWFSNRMGTSLDHRKARGKDYTWLLMPNLSLCHCSSQLFDLGVPSSADVPVLLLNQPNICRSRGLLALYISGQVYLWQLST